MPSTPRPQQRYDHRLRDLVQRTRGLTIATDLGIPRSTARAWLRAAPRVVVTVDLADLTGAGLRQEILKLRRPVRKLAALLRLALALVDASSVRLSSERLPDGPAKDRILRAVDHARGCLPLRGVLRFLDLSPSRFQAWRHRHRVYPRRPVIMSSHLTASIDARRDPGDRRHGDLRDYRHLPTGTLAVLAQRLGKVSASRRRGTASYARMAGGVPGFECIRRSRKSGCARRGRTRCGTSTRRLSASLTEPAPISMR